MRKKQPVPFSHKFPNADPLALRLLQRLLSFDPKDRPTAEQALADPYFKGLSRVEREPACLPISKLEFEFERRRVTKEDVRDLIYREILEYHPQLLKDYLNGNEGSNYIYPSAIGQFKKQFAHLEENCGRSGPVIPLERKHISLPRSTVHSSTIPPKPQPMAPSYRDHQMKEETRASESYRSLSSSSRQQSRVPSARPGRVVGPVVPYEAGRSMKEGYDAARTNSQNAALAPQTATPSPQYYYRPNMTPSQSKPVAENVAWTKQQQLPVQTTHEFAIDINTNPYQQSQTKPEQYNSSRIALDAKLMQAQTQFGASAVAMAAHRNVGTVQYGMS
ncbi:unnamed protein product [Amaranthus hypochondriacus]